MMENKNQYFVATDATAPWDEVRKIAAKPVAGERIKVKGFGGLHLFCFISCVSPARPWTPRRESINLWSVAEKTTGRCLSRDYQSKRAAIAAAEAKLRRKGISRTLLQMSRTPKVTEFPLISSP